MIERTFAMIKPDAVAAKNSGKIIDMIEKNGFTILAMRKAHLDSKKAQEFYAVHKERPFYGELVSFVTSGPVILMALERDNAVKAWRDLMGAARAVDPSATITLRCPATLSSTLHWAPSPPRSVARCRARPIFRRGMAGKNLFCCCRATAPAAPPRWRSVCAVPCMMRICRMMPAGSAG